ALCRVMAEGGDDRRELVRGTAVEDELVCAGREVLAETGDALAGIADRGGRVQPVRGQRRGRVGELVAGAPAAGPAGRCPSGWPRPAARRSRGSGSTSPRGRRPPRLPPRAAARMR